MTDDSKGVLNRKQLEQLVSYFDEKVISAKNYKTFWGEVPRPAIG